MMDENARIADDIHDAYEEGYADGKRDAVVHGHWEEKEVVCEGNGNGVITEWQSCRCSKCKKYDTSPYLYYFKEPKYCSECGAKMDEVTE